MCYIEIVIIFFILLNTGTIQLSLRAIIETLSEYFKKNEFDFGLIGAFALYAIGYVRATKDVDIITRLKYQDEIVFYLESLGFTTIHKSTAFSNHEHMIGSIRVDMMYVDGDTADNIFSSTESKILFKGLKVPVVSAEHLIALKLFAIKNDPDRKHKDASDIEEIIKNSDLKKINIKHYFIKYGQEQLYEELSEKLRYKK